MFLYGIYRFELVGAGLVDEGKGRTSVRPYSTCDIGNWEKGVIVFISSPLDP